MKWLSLWWWRYLFGSRDWQNFWCRLRGHPGPVWYTGPTALEPDMTCRRCGEDLG